MEMKRALFILIGLVMFFGFAAQAHAQVATQHGVNLTWKAPTTDANGNTLPAGTVLTYNVWRANSAAGPFTQINSAPVTTAAYLDPAAGISAGATCVYEVTTLDTGGQGNPSATATVVVPAGGFPVNPGTATAVAAAMQ